MGLIFVMYRNERKMTVINSRVIICVPVKIHRKLDPMWIPGIYCIDDVRKFPDLAYGLQRMKSAIAGYHQKPPNV